MRFHGPQAHRNRRNCPRLPGPGYTSAASCCGSSLTAGCSVSSSTNANAAGSTVFCGDAQPLPAAPGQARAASPPPCTPRLCSGGGDRVAAILRKIPAPRPLRFNKLEFREGPKNRRRAATLFHPSRWARAARAVAGHQAFTRLSDFLNSCQANLLHLFPGSVHPRFFGPRPS
jgi:hypothetical protein